MATVYDLLADTLGNLEEKQFKDFKFRLKVSGTHNNFTLIPWAKLEKANDSETASLLLDTYADQAVEVTKRVLVKIKAFAAKEQLSKNADGVVVPPSQEDIIREYQKKLQANLRNRFCWPAEGTTARAARGRLDDFFVELFITTGGDVHINQQHEVMQIDSATGNVPGDDKPIKTGEIFKDPTGRGKPIRTLLTTGIAGIGKTILVNKFVLEWADGQTNQDVHLLFPLTFRELNLIKTRVDKLTLAELVQKAVMETKDIKTLNDVFTKLQESGTSDFDASDFKLLFVLDGLDESRLQLDFTRSQDLPVHADVKHPASVDVLVTELIKGKLLRSARVWITTRPAAANNIPEELIDGKTEVRGFDELRRVEYFEKRFQNERRTKIIAHIKSSRSLFIMCHIPVFCWIAATVLKNLLETGKEVVLPKTLTDMYTQFLLYQKNLAERNNKKMRTRDILGLAKLAYRQVKKGNPIFYEKDLRDSGIKIHQADNYVGVFTDVFEQVKPLQPKPEGRMFSFVHLSVQEYMAALYVLMSLIHENKNVLLRQPSLPMPCRIISLTEVHQVAIDQAIRCPKGSLDLFLRFFMGLSMQNNQHLLKDILKTTKAKESKYKISEINRATVEFIKKRIEQNESQERIINLFYCLNELQDDSLLEQIQHFLKSGALSDNLPSTLWAALVFFLLSSEEALECFDLKKYSASEDGLLRLLPVVKASSKSLLNGCNLSERSCEALAKVLSSQSCKLRELDLSDNELTDAGATHLAAALEKPHCTLQALRLSGCMITQDGCASLASALKLNPSHLQELDLSFNHPGESGVTLLVAGKRDHHWRAHVKLDHAGEERLRSGVRKYVRRELSLDPNTAHRNLKLSPDRLEVTTTAEEQPYLQHPDRFERWRQVLCSAGLTGRCYWEVQWGGSVHIAVTYRGIKRKNEGTDRCLGTQEHSWVLLCEDDGTYFVRHNDRKTPVQLDSPSGSRRVAVFLDQPAGTLTFYQVADDKLIDLHTFRATFSEPLYPAFGFGFRHDFSSVGSWVSLHEADTLYTVF